MATKFTGGCLCGAVRYECNADPIFMGNCHCRDCQKAGGGAYDAAIGVPAAALKITGSVKYHDTKSASGNTISRGFCPDCGARLFAKSTGFSDLAMFTAGSLDEPIPPDNGHLYRQRAAMGSHEPGAGEVSQNADVR
jgi:hypothetical protein